MTTNSGKLLIAFSTVTLNVWYNHYYVMMGHLKLMIKTLHPCLKKLTSTIFDYQFYNNVNSEITSTGAR